MYTQAKRSNLSEFIGAIKLNVAKKYKRENKSNYFVILINDNISYKIFDCL